MDNGKQTTNKHDNYLKHKTGQIFRYDKNTLSLLLLSTNARNKYLPLLDEAKIKYKEHISGDSEYIFHFPESQLDTVAKIVKLQGKGKHTYPNFE